MSYEFIMRPSMFKYILNDKIKVLLSLPIGTLGYYQYNVSGDVDLDFINNNKANPLVLKCLIPDGSQDLVKLYDYIVMVREYVRCKLGVYWTGYKQESINSQLISITPYYEGDHIYVGKLELRLIDSDSIVDLYGRLFISNLIASYNLAISGRYLPDITIDGDIVSCDQDIKTIRSYNALASIIDAIEFDVYKSDERKVLSIDLSTYPIQYEDILVELSLVWNMRLIKRRGIHILDVMSNRSDTDCISDNKGTNRETSNREETENEMISRNTKYDIVSDCDEYNQSTKDYFKDISTKELKQIILGNIDRIVRGLSPYIIIHVPDIDKLTINNAYISRSYQVPEMLYLLDQVIIRIDDTVFLPIWSMADAKYIFDYISREVQSEVKLIPKEDDYVIPGIVNTNGYVELYDKVIDVRNHSQEEWSSGKLLTGWSRYMLRYYGYVSSLLS